ncbi:MAG: hypothetical protein GYA24_25925 [Candidatus Lokiarchaeota archaeon]|nr:hypothetical protein [Candidatus Lokiarchaeota archaeon]
MHDDIDRLIEPANERISKDDMSFEVGYFMIPPACLGIIIIEHPKKKPFFCDEDCIS